MTTLPIDRRYAGIRIKKASGTTDKKQLRRILGMLDVLASRHRLDLLQGIADGTLSLRQVWDAFQRDGIDKLPTAETLRPLEAAWEKWAERHPCSKGYRQSLGHTLALLLTYADGDPEQTSVDDVPTALKAYREKASANGHGARFNRVRSHCQAFFRRTLGRGHRLWWAVASIDKLPERRELGKALAPDDLRERLAKLPTIPQAMAWEMALHGLGWKEYAEDGWGVREGESLTLHVEGEKRDGRDRWVPLLRPMIGPGMAYQAFRKHLATVGLVPRDLRRTYGRALEAVGIPFSRQKAYMGHGARNSTELYPRHTVVPHLAEDGAKLAAYFGVESSTISSTVP